MLARLTERSARETESNDAAWKEHFQLVVDGYGGQTELNRLFGPGTTGEAIGADRLFGVFEAIRNSCLTHPAIVKNRKVYDLASKASMDLFSAFNELELSRAGADRVAER